MFGRFWFGTDNNTRYMTFSPAFRLNNGCDNWENIVIYVYHNAAKQLIGS